MLGIATKVSDAILITFSFQVDARNCIWSKKAIQIALWILNTGNLLRKKGLKNIQFFVDCHMKSTNRCAFMARFD